MGVTTEDVGKEIGATRKEEARSAEPPGRPSGALSRVASPEYRFTVTGASRDIAMTRSCTFRAHGAVMVRGPVFEAGLWRVYLVQPLKV